MISKSTAVFLRTALFFIILLLVPVSYEADYISAAETLSGEAVFPILNISSETDYGSVTKAYTDVYVSFDSSTYDSSELYSGNAALKLRGNSTSGLSKKPFKLRLESKADLFGMGKSRHWVLLANAIDLTNLRNLTLQEFAGRLGLVRMDSVLVSLYYNGEYMGVYQLSEQVRISSGRVDIYDWSDVSASLAKAVADDYIAAGTIEENRRPEVVDSISSRLDSDYYWITSDDKELSFEILRQLVDTAHCTVDLSDYLDFSALPSVTGGCIIEMDFYNNSKADLLTAYRQPLYLSFPDFTESHFEALENYMSTYIQAFEYALHSTDFVYHDNDAHYKNTEGGYYNYNTNSRKGTSYKQSDFKAPAYDGMHYSEFIDIDSFIDNMLVCELSVNWDGMKNSFFMYKDIDSKLTAGPVWDFDWAFGNSLYGIDTAGRTGDTYTYAHKWQTTNEYFANEQYYQTQQFNRQLIRDPYFIVKLYERYQSTAGELIHHFAEEYEALCLKNETENLRNYERWKNTDSSGGLAGTSYKAQVTNTLNFIKQRVEWLDEQFTDIDTLIASLGYYRSSSEIKVNSIDYDSIPGLTVLVVSLGNKLIDDTAEISVQVNGTAFIIVPVSEGHCYIEIPDELLAKEDGLSVAVVRAVDKKGAYIKNIVGSVNSVYTNCYSNYAVLDKEIPAASTVGNDSYSVTDDELSGSDDSASADNSKEASLSAQEEALYIGFTAVIAVIIFSVALLIVSFKNKKSSRK